MMHSTLKTPHTKDTLKRGARGASVRDLQIRLRREDFDLAINGIFGAASELAVKIYQTGQQLKSDGIVGPKTWRQFDDSG